MAWLWGASGLVVLWAVAWLRQSYAAERAALEALWVKKIEAAWSTPHRPTRWRILARYGLDRGRVLVVHAVALWIGLSYLALLAEHFSLTPLR